MTPVLGRLPAGFAWPHLSMGMSGDFEAAIRQGATLVRIGSALTEGIA
jgi:PLP dependent protein